MNEFKQLLKNLSSQLVEETPKQVEDALTLILDILKSNKCSIKQSKLSAAVITTICSASNKSSTNNYDIIQKYTLKLLPTLTIEHLNVALQYIQYFISQSYQQNKINELVIFFRDFQIQKPDKPESLRIYFDIIKQYSIRLTVNHGKSVTDSHTLKCFNDLNTIFTHAHNSYPSLFCEFCKEIFCNLSYVRIMLNSKFLEFSKSFLKNYLLLMKSLKEVEDLNVFYKIVTSMFIHFVEADSVQDNERKFSQAFLKACLENDQIKQNKYFNYNLMVSWYIGGILERPPDQQQNTFSEVLQKISKLLDRDENTEVWFMDAVVTFTEQLAVVSKELSKIADENNTVLLFNILEKLLKYSQAIKYAKMVCSCNETFYHKVYNICGIAMAFYNRVISLNINNTSIDKFVYKIFKFTVKCRESFSCKDSTNNFNSLFVRCFNCIKSIDNNAERVPFAIQLLDIMINLETNVPVTNIAYLQLYKRFYTLINDQQNLYNTLALYIANLDTDEKYKSMVEFEMLTFIKTGLDLKYKADTLICDVIESMDTKLKPIKWDKNILLREQIAVSAKYKLLNDKELENLAIKAVEKTESHLQFAYIVRHINVVTEPKLLNKIKVSIAVLLKQSTKDSVQNQFEYNYCLGILYKRDAMQSFQEAKDIFKFKTVSEDTFKDLSIDELTKIDISIENNGLKLLLLSIKHFSLMVATLKDTTIQKLIDWTNFMEDISILARQFQLRGYYNYAFKTWKLLYELATSFHPCAFNEMRALSFFCKHYQIIEDCDVYFNLDKKVDLISENLLLKYKEIDTLTPRRQNYVLLCLLDIALYYAHKLDFSTCNAFMNMVLNKINEMEGRKNLIELVRTKLYALEFELATKFEMPLKESPYIFIQNVLYEIRSIQFITSEDSINIVEFLFNFIQDVSYYLMSINDLKSIQIFQMMIARYAFEGGLTLRIAETLSLWAHVNLEMEATTNCQVKLIILDKLMMIDHRNVIESSETQKNVNVSPFTPCKSSNFWSLNDNLLTVEPTRKVVNQKSLSPQNFKMPIYTTKCDLNVYLKGYLNNHNMSCTCEICKQPILKMILTKIGCLYARLYYLNHSPSITETYLENYIVWWNKLDSFYMKFMYRNFCLWALIYYINTLRLNQKFTKAKEICEIAKNYLKLYPHSIAFAYFWKIKEQEESIEFSEALDERVTESPTAPIVKIVRPVRNIGQTPFKPIAMKIIFTDENDDYDKSIPKSTSKQDMVKSFRNARVIAKAADKKVDFTSNSSKIDQKENVSPNVNKSKKKILKKLAKDSNVPAKTELKCKTKLQKPNIYEEVKKLENESKNIELKYKESLEEQYEHLSSNINESKSRKPQTKTYQEYCSNSPKINLRYKKNIKLERTYSSPNIRESKNKNQERKNSKDLEAVIKKISSPCLKVSKQQKAESTTKPSNSLSNIEPNKLLKNLIKQRTTSSSNLNKLKNNQDTMSPNKPTNRDPDKSKQNQKKGYQSPNIKVLKNQKLDLNNTNELNSVMNMDLKAIKSLQRKLIAQKNSESHDEQLVQTPKRSTRKRN